MFRTVMILLMAVAVIAQGTYAEDNGPTEKTYFPIVQVGGLICSPEIQRGIAFLVRQYNPNVELLRESVPEAGTTPRQTRCDGSESPTSGLPYANKHYLTNDNALAAYTLETLGAYVELADRLRASLSRYNYNQNDFIEVAWGETITWPPYHAADRIVEQVGPDYVIQEDHLSLTTDPYMCYFYDWSAYANLAFMAALNEYNQGHRESALRLHAIEMGKFDDRGWRDKAYWDRGGVYETIGPAWGLYVGALIGAPMDELQKLRDVLLSVQDEASGGFRTHYDLHGQRAYPNVETTSLALLALDAYRRRVALEEAIRYLQGEFNPTVGLLRESPVVWPHRYWLATDNRLAVYALQAAGEDELSAQLLSTLRRPQYGDPYHGLIEVLRGEIVAWPPYTPTQTLHDQIGEEEIWLETRLEGNRLDDWNQYADLVLFCALRAVWAGDRPEAQRYYHLAMQMWDGKGFADKGYAGFCEKGECLYETYKLGLALYVARVIGEPRPAAVLEALLDKQAPPQATCDGQPCGGGFYTLYDATGQPRGDTNTETTAHAILGLAFGLPR